MRRTRTRPRIVAALVTVGALAAAIALTSVPAAVGQTVEIGGLGEAGVLRLKLGATDHWRFEPVQGSAITQGIANSNGCKLNQSAWTLVSLTATGRSAYPGFVSDGLGTGGAGEGSGQPCGRVDPGQSLSMKLDTALDGTLIDFAEIDLEAKFGVTIRVERRLDGQLVGFREYDPSELNDDGPDSGDGDNFRLRVPETGTSAFDEIVLKPVGTTGAVSLEGGADGTTALPGGLAETELGGTTDSVFHLIEADGVLDCGDTVTEGASGQPSTSITRGDNADGSTCELIAYAIDTRVEGGQQFVTFRKDLSSQPMATFRSTTTWVLEDAEMPVPPTQISYFDDEGFHDMKWCLKDTDHDGNPNLPPRNAGFDGTEFWCITSQESVLDESTGKITVTEGEFGLGDPIKRR
jgi:hypothetical protein